MGARSASATCRTRRTARRASRGCCAAGASPARCARAVAFIAPDSGIASTHDSRKEWSGRIRSAWTLVSSRNDPKLAMNGICCRNSRAFHAGGAKYARFASITIRIFGGDCPPNNSAIDRDGARGGRRRELQPAGGVHAADERVQRVDGERLEQTVGLRQWRAADQRHRRRRGRQTLAPGVRWSPLERR